MAHKCFPRFSDKVQITFQPRILEKLNISKRQNVHNVSYTIIPNDVQFLTERSRALLFNQQDAEAALELFKAHNSEFGDILMEHSDEEILETVRSRYIQSSCDVLNWSRALSKTIRSTFEYLDSQRKLAAHDEHIEEEKSE